MEEKHNMEIIEERPSRIRKFFIIIISIALLLLFLPYFLFYPYLFDIVEGLFVSSEISNLTVIAKEASVHFENNTYEQVREIYYKSQKHEFKACLFGEIGNKDYIVKNIIIPDVYHQEFSTVVAEICPKEAIISLHSHPYKRCTASIKDFESFNVFKGLNKEGAMMVMCEDDRFFFYK